MFVAAGASWTRTSLGVESVLARKCAIDGCTLSSLVAVSLACCVFLLLYLWLVVLFCCAGRILSLLGVGVVVRALVCYLVCVSRMYSFLILSGACSRTNSQLEVYRQSLSAS